MRYRNSLFLAFVFMAGICSFVSAEIIYTTSSIVPHSLRGVDADLSVEPVPTQRIIMDTSRDPNPDLPGLIGFDESHNLFGLDERQFSQIDKLTGDVIVIGVIDRSIRNFQFDKNGILYGSTGDELVTIDRNTFESTTIGSFSDGNQNLRIIDFAYDRSSDMLYGFGYVNGLGNGVLSTIDSTTGLARVIGGRPFNPITSIEFASDGTLWGYEADGAYLSRMDKSTGFSSGTLVGIGGRGIAFDSVTAVPEPQTWVSLVGLAVIGIGIRFNPFRSRQLA